MREFGDLEAAIMQVMWAGDRPYVVREVRERMQYSRPVAYTTVMTVMNILHRKGVLHREKLGRAWQYWPVEAREDHDARLMAEALRSGGDEDVTMRRFIELVNDEEMESPVQRAGRRQIAAAADRGVATGTGRIGTSCDS